MNRSAQLLALVAVTLVCGWLAVDGLDWTDQLTVISGTLPAGGFAPVRLMITLVLWGLSSVVAPVLFGASLLWTAWDWAVPLGPDTSPR